MISLGEMMILLLGHLFLFESRWLAPRTLSRSPSLRPIVYFDGICTLCNHVVDLIIAEDRTQQIQFASIQGEAGSQVNLEEVRRGESMAFQMGNHIWSRSTGALWLASELGGVWRLLSFCRYIPTWIRDGVYELIQKNRYRMFGQKSTCRLPTPQERDRFLD